MARIAIGIRKTIMPDIRLPYFKWKQYIREQLRKAGEPVRIKHEHNK